MGHSGSECVEGPVSEVESWRVRWRAGEWSGVLVSLVEHW